MREKERDREREREVRKREIEHKASTGSDELIDDTRFGTRSEEHMSELETH